jgi:hypothetical protein
MRPVPHTIPLMGPISQESIQDALALLRNPRDEARAEGGRAFYAPAARSENPYEAGTAEHLAWDTGWNFESQENS